jgi:haloacetate dehalogenase
VFEGFQQRTVSFDGASVFARWAGNGPPILLLHGHPRTSSTWHAVAPLLVAAGYTVVCADLLGYGRSGKPVPTPDHSAHSKRAVADAMVALMRELGHPRFGLVGHDRGSYVALRLALDHPAAIERVALLDCIPISEHLRRADARFARLWWHWFFFAQPDKPERAINADPLAWYGGDPRLMGDENYAEWRAAVSDPSVVQGMLEDYRAGLSIDRENEEADRAAGRKLAMPTMVLWSTRDDLEQLYGDPLAIWADWADSVDGRGIDSGHHMAEEVPQELAGELGAFFRQHA